MPHKRWGGIGALLMFFGAFCPWAAHPVSLFGIPIGSLSISPPGAWIVAAGGLVAAALLFRRRAGSILIVIAVVILAWTILFAFAAATNQASPSWGALITLVGAGLLAYSGHLTNQYEASGA
jgi:hypothetical protein